MHPSLTELAGYLAGAWDAAGTDAAEHLGSCSCAVCGIADGIQRLQEDLKAESDRRWDVTNRVREYEWLEMDRRDSA